MSSVPPCTVIVHVAGDAHIPTSPPFRSRPTLSRSTSSHLLVPPSTRPHYGRKRPSLNDYYPRFRPSWKAAPGEDPDADTITLVPMDSLDLDPDFAPDQPWHRRWRAKSKAKTRKAGGRGRTLCGRVLFCGAVVAIVVLRGLVFLVELVCLPFALQQPL